MVETALLEELLARLAAGGADFAEVYAQSAATVTLSLEGPAPATLSREADGGVSLLLERGGQRLFAAMPTHAPGPLREAAERLAEGRGGPEVPAGAVAGGPEPEPESPELLEALLRAGAQAARSTDPRVFRYEGVAAATAVETVRLDTEGGRLSRRERRVTLYHLAYARGRSEARGGARTLRTDGGAPTPEAAADAAAEAARGAANALEALPSPEGLFPVVLSPQAAGLLLHEAVGRLLEADVVMAGLSPFAGRLGESLAAGCLTLSQGRAFEEELDDEGHPVSPVVLLDRGVLSALLADRRTAARWDLPRTGSGRRASFRHEPLPRTGRLAVTAGEGSLQSLLADVEMGLFVARLGSGEVDGAAGRFRLPAAEAFLVREGQLAEPLRGAALEGACLELLPRVVRAGGRREVHPGVSRKAGQAVPVWDESPALLMDGLTVRRAGP